MLVIKRFSERKKVFRERKKTGKIRAKSKYVTMTRQNANIKETEFDHLFDTPSKYEPHVIASRAKKAARNHDLLALVVHSNVHSSHSHASPSYSHSPQPYYITHPSSVIDYEEDYQGEIQGDA
ncbi:hypothetical protein Tco_1105441 [Tanacetum coccineum]